MCFESLVRCRLHFMDPNFFWGFCFIQLLDTMMFSFRKEDPDEEIPAINLGESIPTHSDKSHSSKPHGVNKTALPAPSVESSAAVSLDESHRSGSSTLAVPAHREGNVDDPFRFLESDRPAISRHVDHLQDSNFAPSSMSPTLRSALLSCSSSALEIPPN